VGACVVKLNSQQTETNKAVASLTRVASYATGLPGECCGPAFIHPPDKSHRRWEPVIIRFAESSKEFAGQGHGGGGGGRASFGATAKTRAGGIAHSERER
jgi:hypothetical protein